MKRKILSLVTTLALSISLISPALATDFNNWDALSENSPAVVESADEMSPRVSLLWKTAFKAAKWLITRVDDASFNREPTITDLGGNWVATSSGSASFGNGNTDVRRVKFTTDVNYTNNHLDVFAQTGITGWLDTITVFIEDGAGNEVEGGQLTHNQHLFSSYDLPLDTYTTYYVYSGNRTWDCWIYRYDFRFTGRSADSTANNMVYNPATQKSYIIPSENFKTADLNVSPRTTDILTSQDLVTAFQDEELNCSVNSMKNYEIGDDVYVRDTIADLKYDASKNTTIMYFGSTEEGCFSWPFAGDLRERFAVGEEVTFKFQVCEEYSTEEYIFETLDYFLKSYELMAEGSAANIDTYLVR